MASIFLYIPVQSPILRLLLTFYSIGATGGIGGAVLDGLVKITPSVSITGLVRTSEQGKILETQYPTIKTVVGSLHDEAVLNTELEKADIVVCTSSKILPKLKSNQLLMTRT